MNEGKERYKRDAKKRTRPNKVTLNPRNVIFARREYIKKATWKHKLQSIAEDSFQTTTTEATTLIVRLSRLKKICHHRVVKASTTRNVVTLIELDVTQLFSPMLTHPTPDPASPPIPTQEHVIDLIISHATDANNYTLYQVRW